jgi:hypothetical protein
LHCFPQFLTILHARVDFELAAVLGDDAVFSRDGVKKRVDFPDIALPKDLGRAPACPGQPIRVQDQRIALGI